MSMLNVYIETNCNMCLCCCMHGLLHVINDETCMNSKRNVSCDIKTVKCSKERLVNAALV